MKNAAERLQYLFPRYLNNSLSNEEYEEWLLLLHTEDGAVQEELELLWEQSGQFRPIIAAATWQAKMAERMQTTTPAQVHHLPRRQAYRWWAAAAVLLISGSLWIFKGSHTPVGTAPIALSADVQPGGNKAVLTLGNGSTIVLDSADNGTIAVQGGTQVMKPDSNLLAYTSGKGTQVVYNTLTTPRGGQYGVTLADGTRVWLNAASSIRFPTAFNGQSREVEITGEAYFEVARDATQLFKVTVNGMTVTVLGTHFNIMAYADEQQTKTTLLEGAVRVTQHSKSIVLAPGQQALADAAGSMTVLPVADVNEVMAWRNNLFWFEDADIRSVMRQVARWYDKEVVIKGDIPLHFTGSIPRNVNVSRVFEILQEAGSIHYTIEANKIIVSP
jgi:transmembrane sensor